MEVYILLYYRLGFMKEVIYNPEETVHWLDEQRIKESLLLCFVLPHGGVRRELDKLTLVSWFENHVLENESIIILLVYILSEE